MSDQPPKLQWKDVRIHLSGHDVLDGLNLTAQTGRSLVVIGGSGQGKSVTIKIAMGLMTPDSGQILIDGEDVTHLTGARRNQLFARFGMLFQGAALFDSLPVWENVAFRLINADGLSRPEGRKRAIEALAKVRLGKEVADLYPGDLSGGMQKRVALARAVVGSPEIIMFDEPTTGLDPITADAVNDLIVEQVKQLGCTAISITHDLASARKIGDDVAMLHGGRIVWSGPVESLDNSGNPYVEQFLAGRAEGPITAAI
ncbi:MAG: ATP-binding cassette domain-containing protein [Caulobacteraceae bacterium]|nr:ATP-binding cassette domain-containing protein [Caulobacteraceae bacterium]